MSNHDREGSYPSNRDGTLERTWREASDEQPPAHLDAAIVAAARRAVGGRGEQPTPAPARTASRTWLTRWQPLVAAASIAGLAFVVVQMLPREHSRAPLPQRQQSAPVATAAQPRTSPAPAATADSPASSVDKVVDAGDRADIAAVAPTQDAVRAPPTLPAAAEATAGDSAEVMVESSADRREAVAPAMAGRVAPAAAAATSAKAATRERDLGQTAPPPDPAAWAARIATLHAAGDLTAAEHVLRDFRATEPHADTYLPESLRSWAQTVH